MDPYANPCTTCDQIMFLAFRGPVDRYPSARADKLPSLLDDGLTASVGLPSPTAVATSRLVDLSSHSGIV
jgi:hypothetical protein